MIQTKNGFQQRKSTDDLKPIKTQSTIVRILQTFITKKQTLRSIHNLRITKFLADAYFYF